MEYGGKSPKVSSENSLGSGDAAFALKTSNIFYTGVFLIMSILMFILLNTGHSWLGKIITTNFLDNRDIGSQCVARTSFSLALWFLIHAFICIGARNLSTSCQFMFHISWKWLHALVYIALWVACWFIPDELFNVYLKAAMYLSFIYLILQILFLIEFFYKLNDKFTENENLCIPLIITIILSAIAIAIFGVDYYLFCPSGCTAHIAIISVNLVLVVILFAISIFVERGSILMSSLISIYIVYLTTIGLFCEGGTCSRLGNNTSNLWFSILASIFTLCFACYSAYSSTNDWKILTCGGECCECFDTCCGLCEPKEDDAKSFSLAFFHFLFALASVYVSMIVTSWGSSTSQAPWSVDRGSVAKWVNLGVSWVCIVLYGWGLIAPYICTNREFE